MMNTTSYLRPKESAYFKDSLNSTYCRKVEKQIDDNNQQLVRRLQRASSQYSQRGMSKSIRNYTKIKTNMAHSRMDQFYDLESGWKSTQIDTYQQGRPYSAKR